MSGVQVRRWHRWLTLFLVGLLVVVVDLEVNDLDILPDFVGRVVLVAAALAVPAVPGHEWMRALLVAAAVAGAGLDVAALTGADIDFVAGLVDDALVLSALALAVRVANELELHSRRRELVTVGILFALLSLGTTAAELLDTSVALLFVVAMATLAILAVLLIVLVLLRSDLREVLSLDPPMILEAERVGE
jgi:SNF family Na+-dependent transporter